MSTGLTYVWMGDSNATTPDINASFIFNDYSEAYLYGEWIIRAVVDGQPSSYAPRVWIWTAGPNQSGYWFYYGGTPNWTSFD